MIARVAAADIITRMAREWLLLETLGDEPTVIASGTQPRNMVPLSTFLRRNRHLGVIRRAIAATAKTNRAISTDEATAGVALDVRPVAMPDGRVHGVWLWAGPSAPPVDPPEAAGAVVLNADTGMLHISPGSAVALGIGSDVKHDSISVAEFYRYIAPNPGETDALGLIVTATEGMSYCATWPGRDDHGDPTLLHFCSRLVVEPNDNGEPERLGRAINIRVGSPAAQVPLLEQQLLNAAGEPGSFRSLVTISTRVLIKWIDTPPAELHWEHDPLDRPKIHPDDEANANFMIDNVLHGNTEAVVRFRCRDDSWMPLRASACLVKLNENATVALVTYTRAAASDSDLQLGAQAPGHHVSS